MSDPLTQVAALIQPRAPFSKLTSAAGQWHVSRSETGRLFYCAILEGRSCLVAERDVAIMSEAGDFVLIPAARHFSMTSVPPPASMAESPYSAILDGEVRLGDLALLWQTDVRAADRGLRHSVDIGAVVAG